MKHFGMFLLGFSLGYLLGPVPAHADAGDAAPYHPRDRVLCYGPREDCGKVSPLARWFAMLPEPVVFPASRPQDASHARECGAHSNIPPCCVAFFVEQWSPVLESRPRKAAFWRACMQLADMLSGYRTFYVRCPACLWSGQSNPLRRCACLEKARVL